MKSIMYHYIRNKNILFPNYNILEKKDYTNQIKKFSKKGLINSYNDNTLKILKKLKYKLAYSVEYRDISFGDIKQKPYELPRYDCNLF